MKQCKSRAAPKQSPIGIKRLNKVEFKRCLSIQGTNGKKDIRKRWVSAVGVSKWKNANVELGMCEIFLVFKQMVMKEFLRALGLYD